MKRHLEMNCEEMNVGIILVGDIGSTLAAVAAAYANAKKSSPALDKLPYLMTASC